MPNIIDTNVTSEIGELEAVILHTPGPEIENMTPENAERALYSDILNRTVALKEYEQFANVLSRVTKCFQVKDLLRTALENQEVKTQLIEKICQIEKLPQLQNTLESYSSSELTNTLIEGLLIERNTLTNYLQQDRYALRPLHNFFFTRDASVTISDSVLINKMANSIRDRESYIMETIFKYSGTFRTNTLSPANQYADHTNLTTEGGDILVARHDTLVVGLGLRTSSQGIDYIIKNLQLSHPIRNIIVQELPNSPESFIHLDMVFTFLDTNKCLVYAPVILQSKKLKTLHIRLKNGQVESIKESPNLLTALQTIGIELEPIYCGGTTDSWIQEREQWHSGANFFAIGPGKIIGYNRNEYTIAEISKHGFEVIPAKDVISNKINLDNYDKYVVTIDGAELSRGGGGARCMTMPVRRKSVIW